MGNPALKNLLELEMHPTAISFSLYVIREYYTGPLEEITFLECDEKFLARKAKYVSVFGCNDNTLEFWIIYNNDEAMGMAWRVITDGEVKNRGIINYELKPYSVERVDKAISDLPIQKPTDKVNVLFSA